MFCSQWRPSQRITVQMMKSIYVFFMLCVITLPLGAVDFVEVQVTNDVGVYHIKIIAEVDASAEYVYRVLTDYKHIYRLNPSITESEILPSPGHGVIRVRTRVDDCTSVLCVELNRVEDVYELPPDLLHTVIVPSLSNISSGNAKWKIEDMEEYTEIVYQAHLEPDFNIFPIVGSAILKRKLRQEMVASITMIECIAKIQEEQDWDLNRHVASDDDVAACAECDPDTDQCQP
jgi:hypothetical protein